jgi:hypothetical protein
MSSFLDELDEYFRTTPIDEIKARWAETEEFDDIGLTVDEYFIELGKFKQFQHNDEYLVCDSSEHGIQWFSNKNHDFMATKADILDFYNSQNENFKLLFLMRIVPKIFEPAY